MFEDLSKAIPIILYAATYLVLTALGITCYLIGPELYISIYEFYSGVIRPSLTNFFQLRDLILITYLSPLLLIFFFYLSFWMVKKNSTQIRFFRLVEALKTDLIVTYIAYAAVFLYSTYVVFKIISIDELINVMTNYKSMINARFYLFQQLKWWQWIFIYSLIPLLSGILFYSVQSKLIKYSLFGLSLFVMLLSMQKRYVLLLLIFVFLIHVFKENQSIRKVIRSFIIMFISIIAIFFAQTYGHKLRLMSEIKFNTVEDTQEISPQYNSNTIKQSNYLNKEYPFETATAPKIIPNPSKKLSREDREELKERLLQIFEFKDLKKLFYVFSMFNRTSIPAIYYFEYFPEKRDFFGLSISDFLPFNEPYNEGKIMWEYLNGEFDGAAICVPFNFSLYARIGVWGTLLISGLLGIILGSLWGVLYSLPKSPPKVIFSAIFCMFMLYLALDNVRTSLYASYGMLWWGIGYLILCAVSKISIFFLTQQRPVKV